MVSFRIPSLYAPFVAFTSVMSLLSLVDAFLMTKLNFFSISQYFGFKFFLKVYSILVMLCCMAMVVSQASAIPKISVPST